MRFKHSIFILAFFPSCFAGILHAAEKPKTEVEEILEDSVEMDAIVEEAAPPADQPLQVGGMAVGFLPGWQKISLVLGKETLEEGGRFFEIGSGHWSFIAKQSGVQYAVHADVTHLGYQREWVNERPFYFLLGAGAYLGHWNGKVEPRTSADSLAPASLLSTHFQLQTVGAYGSLIVPFQLTPHIFLRWEVWGLSLQKVWHQSFSGSNSPAEESTKKRLEKPYIHGFSNLGVVVRF